VVVEGIKDVEALKRLGVSKNVTSMGKGRSIFTFCEDLAKRHKKVVILTDWDRKGGKLARALKEAFGANGVKVVEDIRTKLVILSKKEVKDIESLPTFIENLKATTRRD